MLNWESVGLRRLSVVGVVGLDGGLGGAVVGRKRLREVLRCCLGVGLIGLVDAAFLLSQVAVDDRNRLLLRLIVGGVVGGEGLVVGLDVSDNGRIAGFIDNHG